MALTMLSPLQRFILPARSTQRVVSQVLLTPNLCCRGRQLQGRSRVFRTHATPDGRQGPDDADIFGSSKPQPTIQQLQLLQRTSDNLNSITDMNQLQTALAASVVAEQYTLAARIRDRVKQIQGVAEADVLDWRTLGLPEWLIDRVERLGYSFPTDVQRRACRALLDGSDAIIQSETGSGKTLSFVLPTLAQLQYPPQMYPEDLRGPNALLVVPTMELGVQVALLVFKLFGGNTSSSGRPGDVANIYTYTGPKGIKVRGLLNREEVVMAQTAGYLKGVHVVVATPSSVMQVYGEPGGSSLLDHLQVLAVDEVDECFAQDPGATRALLAAACGSNRRTGDSTRPRPPQTIFIGATQQGQQQMTDVLDAGWLVDPVVVKPWDGAMLPTGLQHRYVVCEDSRRLAVMTRLIRADLAATAAKSDTQPESPSASGSSEGGDASADSIGSADDSSASSSTRSSVDGSGGRSSLDSGSSSELDAPAAGGAESGTGRRKSSTRSRGSNFVPNPGDNWQRPADSLLSSLNRALDRGTLEGVYRGADANATPGDDGGPSARVLVFVNSAEEAVAVAPQLRSVLWEEHRMAVLLPKGVTAPSSDPDFPESYPDPQQAQETAAELAGATPFSGTDPIRALHSFRDNKSSLMLCTPAASRGLDLPAVSHVYNLGVPPDTIQYVHRAGRAGRLGATVQGVITTVTSAADLPRLQQIATEAGVQLTEVAEVAPPTTDESNVELSRKGLEDLFTLL